MARRNRGSTTTVVVGDKRAFRNKPRSRRGGNGKFSFKPSTEWLIGAAAAFAMPQNTMIDGAAMVVASAPVRGLGQARGVAMGYVCGQALQHIFLPMVGINIPDFINTASVGGKTNATNVI